MSGLSINKPWGDQPPYTDEELQTFARHTVHVLEDAIFVRSKLSKSGHPRCDRQMLRTDPHWLVLSYSEIRDSRNDPKLRNSLRSYIQQCAEAELQRLDKKSKGVSPQYRAEIKAIHDDPESLIQRCQSQFRGRPLYDKRSEIVRNQFIETVKAMPDWAQVLTVETGGDYRLTPGFHTPQLNSPKLQNIFEVGAGLAFLNFLTPVVHSAGAPNSSAGVLLASAIVGTLLVQSRQSIASIKPGMGHARGLYDFSDANVFIAGNSLDKGTIEHEQGHKFDFLPTENAHQTSPTAFSTEEGFTQDSRKIFFDGNINRHRIAMARHLLSFHLRVTVGRLNPGYLELEKFAELHLYSMQLQRQGKSQEEADAILGKNLPKLYPHYMKRREELQEHAARIYHTTYAQGKLPQPPAYNSPEISFPSPKKTKA